MSANAGKPDEELSKRLQGWRMAAPLPPRFQEEVWRRIEREEIGVAPGVFGILRAWAGRFWARPAWAAVYVAAALAVGSVFGFLRAGERRHVAMDDLGRQYVESIDPYQMPRH